MSLPTMRRRWLPAAMLAIFTLGAHASAAPLDDPDTEIAKKYFNEGQRLYEAHNYEAALHQFEAGIARRDRPAFWWNIARCEERLEHIDQAIAAYENYLTDNRPSDGEKAKARERITALKELKVKYADIEHAPAGQVKPRLDVIEADRLLQSTAFGENEVTCKNNIKDAKETDVDCGGICEVCGDGKQCNTPSDCVSKICTDGKCAAATCPDATQNQGETDVDCGGPVCNTKCENKQKCEIDRDCTSNRCVDRLCKPSRTPWIIVGIVAAVVVAGGVAAAILLQPGPTPTQPETQYPVWRLP